MSDVREISAQGARDASSPQSARAAEGTSRVEPRTEGSRRSRCLLTTLHPERGLSLALVQHLTGEMPGIEFLLHPSENPAGDLDAVWVCGYQPGNARLVQALRARHPRSTLIVTGRGPLDSWEREVLRAGADTACTWPLPYARLSALLRGARAR